MKDEQQEPDEMPSWVAISQKIYGIEVAQIKIVGGVGGAGVDGDVHRGRDRGGMVRIWSGVGSSTTEVSWFNSKLRRGCSGGCCVSPTDLQLTQKSEKTRNLGT